MAEAVAQLDNMKKLIFIIISIQECKKEISEEEMKREFLRLFDSVFSLSVFAFPDPSSLTVDGDLFHWLMRNFMQN